MSKVLGQYFTGDGIKEIIKDKLKDMNMTFERGLEPSVGTGNLLSLFGDIQIEAYDIDSNVLKNIPESKQLSIHNTDFLLATKQGFFDIIIANPPYVEMKHLPKNIYKKDFGEFLYGRTNIYLAFIVKIIDLLIPNGIAVLIIPTSFKTNESASKTRKYLYANCEITHLHNYGNFTKRI